MIGGPCDWCATGDGADGAKWLLGALRHVGLLGDTGRTHEVRRVAGRQVWACPACAPLVRAGDLEALTERWEGLQRESTGEAPSLAARLTTYEVFRSIGASLLVELAPDEERPSREAREAFAVASARAGTNGAALAAEAPSGAPGAQ